MQSADSTAPSSRSLTESSGLIALVLIVSLFFLWGVALGLNGLSEEERKLGSSFLVMAIIGGAILPAAMGAVSDIASIQHSMAVPTLCFAAVLAFAVRARKPRGTL